MGGLFLFEMSFDVVQLGKLICPYIF